MRQSSRRSRSAKGANDQWFGYVVGAVVVLAVVLLGYQWWQDQQPPSVRYGVNVSPAERAGGQIILDLASSPLLATDGGVVAIEAAGIEAFVVRISDTDYRVYRATSAAGRALKYDPVSIAFVDQKDPTVTFERSSGTQIGGDDRMPRYLCSLSAGRLEIQPVSQ